MRPGGAVAGSRAAAGFTALELALALALGAMLVFSAFGLIAGLERSDQLLSTRSRDTAALLRAHETMRYAFQSLLAAPNEEDEAPASPALPDGAEPVDDGPIEVDGRRMAPVAPDGGDPFEDARFELATYEASEARTLARELDIDLEEDEIESVLKWIKLTLSRSPLASQPSNYWGVRGGFEAMPDNRGGWRLQWTQLDPPQAPVVLVEDAILVLAMALGEGNQWMSSMQATQGSEMPRVIRLILWTRSGARLDWMFEPGVVVGDTE